MKKIKIALLGLVTLLLFPIITNAASGTIRVTGSGTAVVGNNVKVTVTLSSNSAVIGSWQMDLSYDKSYLSLVSSSAEGNGTSMVASSSSAIKSKSYTFTFKVLKSGSTKVSVNSYAAYAFSDLSQMSLSSSGLSMRLMTQAELEATYSKDNNLKALGVQGYELTPEFNKDTLEYNLSIPSDVTSVNIIATKNDNTATISGDGEHEVVEGNNRFEIVVAAQNGSTKTYVVNIEVEDLNPITVKIGNQNYVVIKRVDIITKPLAYEDTTITIGEIEVPAFKNEANGFTLVGLKDESGNILLAIYDKEKNEYKIYNEFNSNTLSLYLTDFPEKIANYEKGTITINAVEVPCYKYSENSRFVVVYGMNIETGEYDYYSYDTKGQTFQIWNQEEINALKEDQKIYLYACIAFGGGLIFAFLLILCLLKKKGKKKKIHKKEKQSKNKETEILETEQVIESNDDMYNILENRKKEKKKKEKRTKKVKNKTE